MTSNDLPDGLYFGMPDHQYHAIPRLSATGIRDLLRGPMVFWENSWLNPNRTPRDSYAMLLGRAYHKRLLEGEAAFLAAYAPRFTPNPKSLNTHQQLKTECFRRGLKVTGSKRVLAERLPLVNGIGLYDQEEYEIIHQGKEFISARDFDTIQQAATMLADDPALRHSLRQGHNEVTILWNWNGIPMKSRIDDIVSREITDLKTFMVMWHQTQAQAVRNVCHVAYEVQKAVYWHAVAAARQMAAEGNITVIGLETEIALARTVYMAELSHWLREFASAKTEAFNFLLWQKPRRKGEQGRFILHSTKGAELRQTVARTSLSIQTALAVYRAYTARFGDQPWQPVQCAGEVTAMYSDLVPPNHKHRNDQIQTVSKELLYGGVMVGAVSVKYGTRPRFDNPAPTGEIDANAVVGRWKQLMQWVRGQHDRR